ncbi:protein disulfide-isomerase like 2-1-like [Zingiber officinale]|uniref:protein disulfide-isomerase like 2-1-like n=1 Tax=Zingiber officinale TaxID=94328 RepID=UPI001C4D0273|nr:protein disulfide-isomerase like 2-1-like [Zingiber officinale]
MENGQSMVEQLEEASTSGAKVIHSPLKVRTKGRPPIKRKQSKVEQIVKKSIAKARKKVCALLSGGGYAEKVAVPAGQLLPIPEGVSVRDAASFPEVACTVWSGVSGYPTLKFFPKENKAGEDYEAERELDDFVKFINVKCGTSRDANGQLTFQSVVVYDSYYLV